MESSPVYMKNYVLIIIGLLCFNFLNAQRIITGVVTDLEYGNPIISVNVLQVGTTNETVTDENGNFALTITTDGQQEIEFEYIGYHLKTLKLDSEKNHYEISMLSGSVGMKVIVSRPRMSMNEENMKLLNRSTPTTIIPKGDLERNDGFSFAPVLNQVPGVFMHNGTLNTNRITIRGIGARSPFSTSKIRAYINEIPLTSGDGETTIEDFDLSLFNKMEINKGGGDVQHGSSLGGTILMKTHTLYTVNNSFQSKTQFGSYNTISTTNEVTTNFDYGWVNLRHSLLHSDGYRNNNESDRQNFSLLSKINGGNFGDFYVLANYTNAKAEIPSSLDSATFATNPQAAAANWEAVNGREDYEKGTFGLSHEKDFYDVNWKIASSLSYTFRKNNEVRPFNILDEKSNMFAFRTTGKYNTNIKNSPFKFVIGTEVFNENYDWQTLANSTSTLLSDNQENRFYYNAFTQADIRLWNTVTLNAGLNVNNTNYELTDLFNTDSLNQSGNYSFEPTFSPRFGVVIEPKFSEKFGEAIIYGNVGHGFSPPTVSETLTPDGQINTNIQPETGWNYEVGTRGFLWKFSSSDYYKIYYDMSVYRMDVENLLVATNLGNGTFYTQNAGKTQHDGFEGLVKFTPMVDKKYFVDVAMSYTFTNYIFKEFVDGNFDYSGNQLTGVPSNSVQTFVDFHYNFSNNLQLYTNFHHQFVDAMPINDANTVYSESYQVTNAKVGLKWEIRKFNFNIYSGINNLFDEHYASMLAINAQGFGDAAPRYYYSGLGRNFYGGLVARWNF